MATKTTTNSTSTTKGATTKGATTKGATTKTPAAPAYRTLPAWLAAMGTATGAATGNPTYRGLLQVATHLAWRGPQGSVAWHKGTNANMVAVANDNGASVGTPVHEAMSNVLAALAAAATTPAQADAAAALAAAAAPAA